MVHFVINVAEDLLMDGNLVLECRSHPLPVSRVRLFAGTIIVGRSRDCGLYVPDPSVSRRHAEITVSERDVRVADLDSRNGTFVDENPVESSSCSLDLEQDVRFGAVIFRLTDGADEGGQFESELSTFEVFLVQAESAKNSAKELLTPAQRKVFDLLLKGLTEKDVAERLQCSQHTVHSHTREIYRLVGVHTRAELLSRLLPRD